LILTPDFDTVPGYDYLWSTGGTSIQIAVVSGGTYTLTVSDSYGCEAVRSINVADACEGSIYVPNTFTPNNDGINEEFRCYGSNIGLAEFSVYSRWGQLVFQSDNISEGWNGNNAPEGLYIWKAVYSTHESRRQAQKIDYGTVLVLR
jgi:gliding motility-associated-like protein